MRKYLLAAMGLGLLLCLLGAWGTASGSPDTFTVNTTDDTDDGKCGDHCSLREAIDAANDNAGPDTIEFNIPTSDPGYQVSGITGTWTISLTEPLPSLSGGGTTIDGATQATNQGDLNIYGPEIEVTGVDMFPAYECLWISSNENVIHGLVINRCPDDGVLVTSGTNNTVSGSYIGIDATGTEERANSGSGVAIRDGAHNNTIGGDTADERNVISGNDGTGVSISGSGTDGNTVSGNYIGTDRTGTQELGNTGDGVFISAGAQGNIIGGLKQYRNVISGNHEYGVYVRSSGTNGNSVSGNFIGTDETGTQGLGNDWAGVRISNGAQSNTVGGEGGGNVISDNGYEGVEIHGSGTDGNTVSGNFIGLDAEDTQALGNGRHGVSIEGGAQSNTIGGDTSSERNVISGNGWSGVEISGSGTNANTVSGNYIGIDVKASVERGNGWDGVFITDGAQDNAIGGRNVISGNDEYGVRISGSLTMSNTVFRNYIGTDDTGTQPLGNEFHGVLITGGAQNNIIGGHTSAERNVISGNGSHGVNVVSSGTDGNTVSGNYIGTDRTGAEDLGNGSSGVSISGGAQNNTVGGDTSGEGNVISGNDQYGVRIEGSGTDGNAVSGNYIGTDETGTNDRGNAEEGVSISGGAQNNTVGGGNVISGNDQEGVSIWGSGTMSNTVSGNYIGTDLTGTAYLGNTWSGVHIGSGAQSNTIGGDTSEERNIISGNNAGVSITGSGTNDNTVSGNCIGTDETCTVDLGNLHDGVRIESGAQSNTIGGDTSGERNVISGNDEYGVWIDDSGTDDNTVSGNCIGTDETGTIDLGNLLDGVGIGYGAQDNTVGPENLIAYNVSDGVAVDGASTTGNRITQNSIYSNGDLGIRLTGGANGGIAAPTVSAANTCFVMGTAGAGNTVEVFTSPDEEGKTYLATASADGGGHWSVVGSFAFDVYVTATATDASGNTSEFSAQVTPGICSQIFLPLTVKNY